MVLFGIWKALSRLHLSELKELKELKELTESSQLTQLKKLTELTELTELTQWIELAIIFMVRLTALLPWCKLIKTCTINNTRYYP